MIKGGFQHQQNLKLKTKLNPNGESFVPQILEEIQKTVASLKEDIMEMKIQLEEFKA